MKDGDIIQQIDIHQCVVDEIITGRGRLKEPTEEEADGFPIGNYEGK